MPVGSRMKVSRVGASSGPAAPGEEAGRAADEGIVHPVQAKGSFAAIGRLARSSYRRFFRTRRATPLGRVDFDLRLPPRRRVTGTLNSPMSVSRSITGVDVRRAIGSPAGISVSRT